MRTSLSELYGSRVFGEQAMRAYLPPRVCERLRGAQQQMSALDAEMAPAVARGMMEWALALGATHYTHWFQPLTSLTAGKHDAFLEPDGRGGVMTDFSHTALVRGEPDASSFPSGGLRATFEARGYTAWDPTSPAFVKDGTLYVPTAFCSYTGEALDQKTPLLRSMQAVNVQALRLLRALGDTETSQITPTVGAEQEYFLVDRALYERRLDLKICGRTLIGAKPPKAQELDDHYCGRIRLRVADFMRALDEELWALGVPSKTKHNEAAPAQHEMAPVFDQANVACDHNQLAMETMRVVAKKKDLACLLHEKPFEGVNGSGKHNNYSLTTDKGRNLLKPAKDPVKQRRFLLMLAAFIEAVDTHADLLRLSAACSGNDERLGGFEAPPSVISVFLGDALTQELVAAGGDSSSTNSANSTPEPGHRSRLTTGVAALLDFDKDDSDRNRTSPFAFTGDKFEFRMLGSSQSIALANVVLNTALADVFSRFATRLERASGAVDTEIGRLISETIAAHGRVIFNGDNYSAAWRAEAQSRGLQCVRNSVDAFEAFTAPENVTLFEKHGVFSASECRSRREILLENYAKTVAIEVAVLLEMATKQLYPAVLRYAGDVARGINGIREAGAKMDSADALLRKLTQSADQIDVEVTALRAAQAQAAEISNVFEQARFAVDELRNRMRALRNACDAAEQLVDHTTWPIPTYTDLLLRV